MLTVGGVVKTARYPHTAKILQFGGRFDSEGVELARIHIPQLSLSTLWCGGVASAVPTGEGGGSESRGGAACRAGLRWFVVQLPVTDTG